MPVYDVAISVIKTESANVAIRAKSREELKEALSHMVAYEHEELIEGMSSYDDRETEFDIFGETEQSPVYAVHDGKVLNVDEAPTPEEEETEDEKYMREYGVNDPRQIKMEV